MNISDIDYKKDYYKILDIDKTATKSDIKKAFRKASLQWHPDKHSTDDDVAKAEAENKFKEVNEAYTILSDDNLRAAYDAGEPQIDPFAGFNPFHSHNTTPQPPPLGIRIHVTYDDICHGFNKTIKYRRTDLCEHCHGEGGYDFGVCPDCNGTGWKTVRRQTRMGYIQNMTPCMTCAGTGKIAKHICEHCHGDGTIIVEQKYDLSLTPSMMIDNGAQIQLSAPGNVIPGNNYPGPVYGIIVHDTPDNIHIGRDNTGMAIVYNIINLPYYDMLLGTKVEITTPRDKKVIVTIPENCADGQLLRLKGQGIIGGDYIVVPHLDLSLSLSDKEKELLKEIQELKKNTN